MSSDEESERRRRKKDKKSSRRYDSDDSSGDDRKKSKKHKKQKKEKKKRSRKRDRGEEEERAKRLAAELGYSAEDNPFGDPRLHEQFVWKRKEEVSSSGKGGGGSSEPDLLAEVQRVKRRRREHEDRALEREEARLEKMREQESELFGDVSEVEARFHAEQLRRGAALRIRQGRERPLDVLVKNVLLVEVAAKAVGEEPRTAIPPDDEFDEGDPAMNSELSMPWEVVEGLEEERELVEVVRGVRDQLAIEGRDGFYAGYWKALLVVCEAALYRRQRGIQVPERVAREVGEMLRVRTTEGLSVLEKEAEKRLKASSRKEDDQRYWSHVLQSLQLHRAKQQLRQWHLDLLRRRLDQLTALQAKSEPESTKKHDTEQPRLFSGGGGGGDPSLQQLSPSKLRPVSPPLLAPSEVDPKRLVSLESFTATIRSAHAEARRVFGGPKPLPPPSSSFLSEQEDDLPAVASKPVPVAEAAARGYGDMEELEQGDEVRLGDASRVDDKFQPRLPRFSNLVRTGFDWNRYNKTHFDRENPPPKVVQGYKFNIFYPDLLDDSVTPQYVLEPADSPEFCIIRFHAGPPYEDIAFKIKNAEWDKNKKQGFRVSFDRGVLRVHFNFKRNFYKR